MQAVFWLPGTPPQLERRVWLIVIIGDYASHVCTYMHCIAVIEAQLLVYSSGGPSLVPRSLPT